jgi:hypothetical protein
MRKRLAHADDLVRGQRARAQAALVAAAVNLRLDAHARLATHVQRADALGAVGLVRREAHQVDRAALARSIATLPVACAASTWKTMPRSRQMLADRGDVLDHADLVVDRASPRRRMVSGRSAACECVEVEQAVGLARRGRSPRSPAARVRAWCRASPCARSSR